MSFDAAQERNGLRDALVWADLASGMGALVIGVGIGIFVGTPLRAYASALILGGTALHAWGMFRKHRLQRELLGPPLIWAAALNLLCWALVLLLLVLTSLAV